MDKCERDEIVMALVAAAGGQPADAREAYLRSAGAGDDIVAEVLDLAAWEDSMGGFLHDPLLRRGAFSSAESGRRVGHYRIAHELGRGGMGIVFKALDEKLGRPVALKVLSGVGGSQDRKRLLREAQAASHLNHPNIVTVHEFGSDADADFIAMEYIEGHTLDKALTPRPPLSSILGYARQVADALAKAHAAGVVHRDLKPANIMVTPEGRVKVLDFGLAKQQPPPSEAASAATVSMTQQGVLAGTPQYMSPDQVVGERIDARSDIFSFGIVLYEMVCGERPFQGPTAQAVMVAIAGQPHRSVRDLQPEAPPVLASLIDRCLAKDRAKRLASMDLAVSELAAIAEGLDRRPARRTVLWIGAAALSAIPAALWIARPQPSAVSLRFALVTPDRAGPALLTTVFQGGSEFRLRAACNRSGFLYLINEGPGDDGRDRFFVLHPRPGASASVAAGETKLTGRQIFDNNPGTERFWIVWSRGPIDALDAAVNGSSKGLVEPTAHSAIQSLLASIRPQAGALVDATGEMEVQGAGDMLGSLIELRHR